MAMKSISSGTLRQRARSTMNITAPLRMPTNTRSLPAKSREIALASSAIRACNWYCGINISSMSSWRLGEMATLRRLFFAAAPRAILWPRRRRYTPTAPVQQTCLLRALGGDLGWASGRHERLELQRQHTPRAPCNLHAVVDAQAAKPDQMLAAKDQRHPRPQRARDLGVGKGVLHLLILTHAQRPKPIAWAPRAHGERRAGTVRIYEDRQPAAPQLPQETGVCERRRLGGGRRAFAHDPRRIPR